MSKVVFYLSGTKAQHEGNRLLLASKMIEFGFEKGAVFNLPDGRVEVLLEGERERIEKFHTTAKNDFTSWVMAKTEEHNAVKEQIGNPGIMFSDLDFNDDLLVHKLEIYGHSLTFDQIHKGVDVYKELTQAIRELRGEL
ncbi:MAG: acylphosphatase [Candidatus Aenigmarchaeota archaeon]|nr:acylphosphatase [Candidatus Aenigmarchaeota archaeon]